jgi:hypothetical protein
VNKSTAPSRIDPIQPVCTGRRDLGLLLLGWLGFTTTRTLLNLRGHRVERNQVRPTSPTHWSIDTCRGCWGTIGLSNCSYQRCAITRSHHNCHQARDEAGMADVVIEAENGLIFLEIESSYPTCKASGFPTGPPPCRNPPHRDMASGFTVAALYSSGFTVPTDFERSI